MKVAVLVLAFRAPAVLERLVEVLGADLFHFYVHLDAKADFRPFERLAGIGHVSVLPTRLPIFWGGFNMVEAELALLRVALTEGRCNRFALISDDTFALHGARPTWEALQQDVVRIGHFPVGSPLRQRYDGFYFFDSDATSPQHRPPSCRDFTESDLAAVRRLGELRARGKAPVGTLYHGPQWWSLTTEAARHVIDAYGADPALRESFRFSAIPDEQYIQTLIGREADRWRTSACPVYADFNRDPQPYVFTAAEETRPARESDHLFIRKVAQEPGLLDALARMAA